MDINRIDEIREGIKALIKGVYDGEVIVERGVDARSKSEFVNVLALKANEVGRTTSGPEVSLDLVVAVYKKRASDKELEILAKPIADAMLDKAKTNPLRVRNVRLVTLEYAPPDKNLDEIYLVFSMIF